MANQTNEARVYKAEVKMAGVKGPTVVYILDYWRKGNLPAEDIPTKTGAPSLETLARQIAHSKVRRIRNCLPEDILDLEVCRVDSGDIYQIRHNTPLSPVEMDELYKGLTDFLS